MQINLRKEYKKVEIFEKKIADYTGSKYAVCVDCCTNALLLSFLLSEEQYVTLPTNTYVGVAFAAHHAGKKIKFISSYWKGCYLIPPTNIYDSAKRFTCNMYIKKSIMCVSFHYKKHLKIGRGGAILTDSKTIANQLKLMRNCGKDVTKSMSKQTYNVVGYNMLMHPDLAEKGMELLKTLPKNNEDLPDEYYGDLEQQLKPLLPNTIIK
jgi:dTDP-4-amino-4,6-dideoxygalactose transaminase